MPRRARLPALVVVGLALAVGCGDGDDEAVTPPAASSGTATASPSGDASAADSTGARRSDWIQRAIETAEQRVGGAAFAIDDGTVEDLRTLDVMVALDDGRAVRVAVTTDGEDVLDTRAAGKAPDDVTKTQVDLANAIALAEERAGGRRFDDAALATRRGELVYVARFRGRFEIALRASDGLVAREPPAG